MKYAETCGCLFPHLIFYDGLRIIQVNMQNILFYISGHGYGHATRSIEVVKKLVASNPNLFFHIRTDAPSWLFESNLKHNYQLHPLKTDVGVVQETSFVVNKKETLRLWQKLLQKKELIIKEEAGFARSVSAAIVLSDISPLAFDVAAEAGIRAVGLSNFSWDWIYKGYVQEFPEFTPIIHAIRASYQSADLLLRLPFSGDLSVFPVIKDIPLISRKAAGPAEAIWQKLNINKKKSPPLVLVALRPSDLALVELERLEKSKDFVFITSGLKRKLANSIDLPPHFVYFPELVNACDLVLSKPGYGIVSEIIANQTPLLYISRDDFAEYKALVEGLGEYAISAELPREHFFTAQWSTHLQELLQSRKAWKEVALDGAEKASDCIAGKLAQLNLN